MATGVFRSSFLEPNSSDYFRMYLAPSTTYARWGAANLYGQLLVLGKDGNVAQVAGQSFDMGLQDGEAYGIAAMGIYGDDDGDDLGSQWARLFESQITFTVSQTGDTSIIATRGCIAFVAGVDWGGSFASAVEGQIEFLGATDLDNASDVVGVSGVQATISVGASSTVGRERVLAGVRSNLSAGSGVTITQTGSSGPLVEGALAAFVASNKTGTRGDVWDDALYIDGANNALGFRAVDNDYSCGIKAETSTPSGAKSHSIRINVAGTAGYIMVYAGEAG